MRTRTVETIIQAVSPLSATGAASSATSCAQAAIQRVPNPKLTLFASRGFLDHETCAAVIDLIDARRRRSEEHKSEIQSLIRKSYTDIRLQKKKTTTTINRYNN